MAQENTEARLTASAPTRGGGRLYLSSALTPYGVESFCDHIARLGCRFAGEVHVSVDPDGLERGCPELRALTHCVKRLRSRGVVVRVHTARLRKSALQSVKVDRLALAR